MYKVGGYHFRINALLVLGKCLEMDIFVLDVSEKGGI